VRPTVSEVLSRSEAELFEHARPMTLLTGERLCVAGDRDLGVYVVRSGMLKLIGNSASGRESIICLAFPGEIIGEVAAFDGRPQPVDVVAASRSELLAISAQALVRAVLEVPGVAVAAGALMARRSRWMCDTAVERNIRYAPARLAGACSDSPSTAGPRSENRYRSACHSPRATSESSPECAGRASAGRSGASRKPVRSTTAAHSSAS
jgi:hypothetical protein